MSVSIGDFLKVVAVLQWVDGDIMQNVFNCEVVGTGGPYDNQDVTDDMEEWIDSIYDEDATRVNEDVSGAEVRVYVYDPVGDDWDEIGTNSWDFVGEGVSDILPRGVALLINAKTTDADVNGKKYFGGAEEAAQTDGLWTAAMITSYVLIATKWVQDFTGTTSTADFDPGVWSTITNEVVPMSGTIILPSIPAYQRRRKQGIGI